MAIALAVFLLLDDEPPRPRILGLAHVAIFAKDYEKSRAFYRDFLGFENSPSAAFFEINERQYIELLPEQEPNSDRLSHIALETDNAEAMRVYLKSRGISVPGRAQNDHNGNLSFSIKDPEGHSLEIVQYGRGKIKHTSSTRISSRLMHAGIIVTRLDPAMKFYTAVLGFTETWRGSKSGTELSWVNLKVPDGEDYIEFMLFKDMPPPTGRGTSHHLCLEVSDAATSVAALEANAYRGQYPHTIEVHTGTNRKRQANLYDPDGTRTELMELRTVDGKAAASSTAPPPRHE